MTATGKGNRVSTFNPAAVTSTGTACEQQELSSTDKEKLDKQIEVAKRAEWIGRGVRHSSDGVHMATLVRQQIDSGALAKAQQRAGVWF